MEQEHREILRSRRIAIAEDLEPLKLLNRLDVLDDDDREEIKTKETRREQAYALLDMLIRKGPNAFKNFVSTLYELKSQKHLADLLIQDSGIQIASIPKDNTGMTSQHKEILRKNVENLHRMSLDKMVTQLSGLLDEQDKQNLLNFAKPVPERVDMLLTEVLPRRGPTAFDLFVQGLEKVHPSMAEKLLQDAGLKVTERQVHGWTSGQSDGQLGSSYSEGSPIKFPVQDSSSYSFNTPVQDILEERPELLKEFRHQMDEDDIWGNGWKRFYKELGLPAGKESAMEGRDGGPTFHVIKGWISLQGRNATVQALLGAVNRSERKDCTYYLEKSLGCQLDCVDSPIDNLTKGMGSLSHREVKFFGDLNDSEASLISSKLGQNAKALLRKELGNSNIPTKDLILQSKNYPIRRYTDLVPSSDRETAIKALREALPTFKGVTGPMLSPITFIREVGYTFRRNLTRNLCADDHWKFLAERLGMDNNSIKYLDSKRVENPADEVLRYWEVKANSTVGALYDILVDIGCPFIADLL
ncbi:uncharacterized protein LOC144667044 isoform X2 [Oculina patagonica]